MTALRLIALLAAAVATHAAAQTIEIPQELWDRPRTGRALMEQESLKRAVTAALVRPDAQIIIHHGTRPETLMQAEELRSWLGALAIDPRRITLRSAPGGPASLRIEIEP